MLFTFYVLQNQNKLKVFQKRVVVKWAILEVSKNENSSATLLIYQNYEKTHYVIIF